MTPTTTLSALPSLNLPPPSLELPNPGSLSIYQNSRESEFSLVPVLSYSIDMLACHLKLDYSTFEPTTSCSRKQSSANEEELKEGPADKCQPQPDGPSTFLDLPSDKQQELLSETAIVPLFTQYGQTFNLGCDVKIAKKKCIHEAVVRSHKAVVAVYRNAIRIKAKMGAIMLFFCKQDPAFLAVYLARAENAVKTEKVIGKKLLAEVAALLVDSTC